MSFDVSEADGHWLAGLTDGEGCFYFKVRDRKIGGPSYVAIDFCFKISLRADDVDTLREVQRILNGLGIVTKAYEKNRQATYMGKLYHGKPIRAFQVYRKAHIGVVIEFFRQFPLRSKKRRDFEIWSAAFDKFDAAMVSASPIHTRKGVLDRPSERQRRPMAGTPRQRFRSVPMDLLAELRAMATDLTSIRAYR